MNNFWKSFLCVIACVFLCVASFFTGYFYRDTVIYNEQQSLSAISPLDTTSYSFVSSNFPVYVSFFNGSSNGTSYNWDDLSLTDYAPIIIRFNTSMGLISGFGYFSGTTQYGFQITDSNVDYNTWVNLRGVTSGDSKYFSFSYYISSLFNFNVKYVNIFTADNFQGRNDKATAFKFYDSNDNVLELQFLFDDTNAQYYEYSNRTYYYLNDFSDNAYYNQGYTSGYDAGSTAGYNSGYNVGYSSGYSIGDTAGYNRGLNAVNTYTFNNLFGAMFDVPVHIITGLLNFNFLGVNLFEFATGIITFVLVVRVVGFIMGKK